MEVGAAVRPPMHMNTATVRHRPHGCFDPHDEGPKFCSHLVIQTVEVDVFAGFEKDRGRAGASWPRADDPTVVPPDDPLERIDAPQARLATLTGAR